MDKRDKIYTNTETGGNMAIVISICTVILLYWRWLFPGAITLGDWGYYTNGSLSDLSGGLWGPGLGGYQILGSSMQPLIMLTGFLFRVFHWSYPTIERLTYFFPLLLCLIFSPWFLAKTIGCGKFGIAAAILVFNLNSITFLNTAVTTMAIAVSLGPFIIAAFIKFSYKPNMRNVILLAIIASIQIIYDVRIAYIYLSLCILYFVFSRYSYPKKYLPSLLKLTLMLALAGFIIAIIHSFWLMPLLLIKTPGAGSILPQGYDSPGWVGTLSYWSLLHALSLQSPWWGKPGIINPPNPQFLFIPILAFSAFLLPIRKQKAALLFFGLCALIFSFLSKGSKPPFGELYIWAFLHIPGFSMFREPGKWWYPVIPCYSMLIAILIDYLAGSFALKIILLNLKERFKRHIFFIHLSLLGAGLLMFFLIFPVEPLSALKYTAMFTPRPIPSSPRKLEDYLHNQGSFFRCLWLPMPYRFGYSSFLHPALGGFELGQGIFSSLLSGDSRYPPFYFSYLKKPYIASVLRLLGFKYLVVAPADTDVNDEIYYWYDLPKDYYCRLAGNIPGIIKVSSPGVSDIYEVEDRLPHLYTCSQTQLITTDASSLIPVIFRTDYGKGEPVLTVITKNILSSGILLSSNGLILTDCSPGDIAVETAGTVQIPLSSLKKFRHLKITIPKQGIYELWGEHRITEEEELAGLITIDNKNTLENGSRDVAELEGCTRYLKLGEWNLSKSSHIIKIEVSKISKIDGVDTPLILLLTDKTSRQKNKKEIFSMLNNRHKQIMHIFHNSQEFFVN